MKSGDPYDVVKKVVSIIITDDKLIPNSTGYHHRFILYDPDAGVSLSDLIEINTLELCKLPSASDGTELYDWARFLAAESEEDLKMVTKNNSQIEKAVVRLVELSADERAREAALRREMGMWDYNASVRWGIKQRNFDMARKALDMGLSLDDIVQLSDLSREEIEELRQDK